MPHLVVTPDDRPKPTSDARIREAEKDDKWDENSITRSYHRIRFEELPAYVARLKENDKEKLRIDARRIKRSRDRLSRSNNTSSLFPELRDSFARWRLNAENDTDAKFKHSSAERGRYLKRLDFIEDVVDSIEDLEDDENPAHDFKTGVLFFEQYKTGWRKATHHGQGFDQHDKFPNQKMTVHKALFGRNQNPFGETKDPKGKRHLKYIHLPANHMGWVEVSLSPRLPLRIGPKL